jgi:hypothetical protein
MVVKAEGQRVDLLMVVHVTRDGEAVEGVQDR